MTPAEVDTVLAHLADYAAALPQAARQLGDIIEQAKNDNALRMDTLTQIDDPDLTIDTARLYLDRVDQAALELYRLVDAAHNETAHIARADIFEERVERDEELDVGSPVRLPERRRPPPKDGTGSAASPCATHARAPQLWP